MKTILLAGGFGTRLSEETNLIPKPMVEIGGKPMLWHIMKIYSHYGFNDFIICCGYKGYIIKEYFSNYFLHMSDVTFDMNKNTMEVHTQKAEPWRITLVDTGLNTMTGGRIKRVANYLEKDEDFMLTYGDGLSDVNIKDLIDFHRKHGKLATMTAVQPAGRFGALKIQNNNEISSFEEKPVGDGNWINGGFFVLNQKIVDKIDDDQTIFERKPLEALANSKELMAYHHNGFWQCMDTLRDKIYLEESWQKNNAKWKLW